ncbi:MAG: hypothetical protein CVT89_07040 [Candidatus Altiarchaeales archaeon HGW-Altiarchaeales-2]|nr:MAG: hypothetical protein CVT89_07040 [Candidatus Altiarchaeales archaeon HGW-Altiarchaeales-2]
MKMTQKDWKSKVVLDTCVLLRFFLDEDSTDKVGEILEQIETGNMKGYVSVLTITELIVVLSRNEKELNNSNEEIVRKCLDYVFKTLIVVSVSTDIAILGAKYKLEHTKACVGGKRGLSYVDGIIAGTAERMGCGLLTYDSEFGGIEEITVMSPDKF